MNDVSLARVTIDMLSMYSFHNKDSHIGYYILYERIFLNKTQNILKLHTHQ